LESEPQEKKLKQNSKNNKIGNLINFKKFVFIKIEFN